MHLAVTFMKDLGLHFLCNFSKAVVHPVDILVTLSCDVWTVTGVLIAQFLDTYMDVIQQAQVRAMTLKPLQNPALHHS